MPLYTPPGLTELDIARGLGHATNAIVIGKRLGVTVLEEDIWNVGGTRTQPTTTATLSISSSSASDAAAGTGARTVFISGLNSAFDPISEIITMNGVSAVTTANSYRWFQSATVITAGSNRSAVGTITITHSGNTQGQIDPNESMTFATHYMVPNGHTAFAHKVLFSLSGKRNLTINGVVRTANNVDIGGLKFFLVEQPFEITLVNSFFVQQKATVWSRGLVEAGVSDVQTTIIFRLVPNGYVSPAISG